MKRLAAILFLLVLLFNFYGYRAAITFLERKGDVAMEQKLDAESFSDDELISIKTTLNLPYYTSSPKFERAYGSVNIHGVVYEYVKKRVYKDTLELLCLPNAAKTKLQGLKNELAKSGVEGQASTPLKKGSTTLKITLPDYCQSVETASSTATQIQTIHLLRNETATLTDYSHRQERPPQAFRFVS